MRVAVFSTKSYDREYLGRFNPDSRYQLTFFEAPLNSDTVNLATGFGAVCAFVNDKLDRTVLEAMAAAQVRAVVLRCAGFNNVDTDAARALGIRVLRVPAYSPEAVAEHTVALILALNRKTHKAYNRVREHNYSLERLTGFTLHGKTVGVIGTGRIGLAFASIMLGFGCRVVAFDPYPAEALRQRGVEFLPLDEVFRNADIVSLHCPLTPETFHLINAGTLELMKPGVMLINTGRGALIDAPAVVDALKTGQVGYLGIDVYEQEEHLFFHDLSETIVQDDVIARLMSFPNVLVTAHQGFFTREALEQIAQTTFANLEAVERSEASENAVV